MTYKERNNEYGLNILEIAPPYIPITPSLQYGGIIDYISPEACRNRIEDNFTIAHEAENYLNIFKLIVNGGVDKKKSIHKK